MNVGELIDKVAKEVNIPKPTTKETFDSIINNIVEGVKSGETIRIAGFGTFSVVDTKSGEGRNPKTGEKIDIPASKKVKFIPSERLKAEVKA